MSNDENKPVENEHQNSIENADETHDSGTPSANLSGRETSSKMKVFALIFVTTIIVLVGAGLSINRLDDSRKADKAEAQAKASQDQKKISETTDKLLPMPDVMTADASAPVTTDTGVVGSENTTTPVTANADQQPQVIQPAQPNYSQYGAEAYNPQPQPIPAQSVQVSQPAPAQYISEQSRKDDNVLVDFNSTNKAEVAMSADNKPTKNNQNLSDGLKSTIVANGVVKSRGSDNLVLSKGTIIPCVLRTKINSTYQGFTTCQVSKDVYSANGRTLLIERGSSVFGEQNTQLNQGQAKVAVLWSRIETPKGVSIDINSPASGQLGEMGLDAKVNNHFWKRFGGAIMLSLIKDVTSNLSTNLAKGDSGSNNVTTNNTTETSNSMAEKILENTINIPPTATVNQGKMISIFVVRDVDFGGVYDLQRK